MTSVEIVQVLQGILLIGWRQTCNTYFWHCCWP